LLDVEDLSLVGKEEWADYTRNPVLSQHPLFKQASVAQKEIYARFKDLDCFTAREVGIMKEYKQIGLVKVDEKGQTIVDYKTDPLVINERGVPTGIAPPKTHFPDYSKMSQAELQEIYEADYPITVPKKGNFMRMKPEKEAEKHKATAMRFIEWKRDLDERAANQIKKRKMKEAGIDMDALVLGAKKESGYAMSSHAIKDKYEREGLIMTRFEINKERKKKGIKYWKRYIGGHFRPRRSSTKRWNHMWKERMVLDRKVSKRGSYRKKSINRT